MSQEKKQCLFNFFFFFFFWGGGGGGKRGVLWNYASRQYPQYYSDFISRFFFFFAVSVCASTHDQFVYLIKRKLHDGLMI